MSYAVYRSFYARFRNIKVSEEMIRLKGLGHQMKKFERPNKFYLYFLHNFKKICFIQRNRGYVNDTKMNKTVEKLSANAQMVFKYLGCLVRRKTVINFLISSVKTLIYSKGCSESRIRISVPAFLRCH
jgi:hypothetical protein